MGLFKALHRLDQRAGYGPKPGESRRDHVARMAAHWTMKLDTYGRRAIYAEMVELYDRLEALEQEVADLRAQNSQQ
jgi:hypothetical protein